MKKLTFLRISFAAIMIIVASNISFAQELPGPPVGFILHPAAGNESIDSLTVGSAVQYWVEPDAAILGAGSTFGWSISGLGAITATTTNLATITYGNTAGTGTINVIETSPAPSCGGSTRTINFAVINVPTANFGADPSAQCASAGALTFTLPITVTTDIAGASPVSAVRVNYTVYSPSAAVISGPTNIDLLGGALRTFNVTIPGGSAAGTYYVVINSISDRISRKPAIDIPGTFGAGNDRIDLVVSPIPVTGPIYHLPNM